MYSVEIYGRVRRAVYVEGMSERQVAREFGLVREPVRKMLQYAVPQGYRRQQPAKRPKLDAWVGVIDQILEEDRSRPRKQRHTAKRIHERLRAEHGFSGGYTIVKDYVRLRKVNQREMVVPLVHPPGDAQADFGEALVVIGGAERKAHYLAIDLPQSDDCVVRAFPPETAEACGGGHEQAIGGRFEQDRLALLPLPTTAYEACHKQTARVSSLALVRYRRNDYSVPVCWGHREVLVKGYVHEVVISCGAEVIARHSRSYEREDMIFDPLHYLALLEQKTNALDQAAALVGWELPAEFAQLRRLLEARLSKRGKREYVQVLRLLETFSLAEVARAVADALRMRAISFDAVKHLLLCTLEQGPPGLALEHYPPLPVAHVATTAAADYLALVSPATLPEGVR